MEKQVQVSVPFEYEFKEGVPDDRLILLHGYQLNGRWMMKRFNELNFEGRIVSPSAPLPVPYKSEAGWMVTYAWYLFDPDTGKYHIPMQRSVDFLKVGLKEWVEQAKRVRIIGFSQGGYLAPFYANSEEKVSQVIGVGARFRSEVLIEKYDYRFDAVHGSADQSVEFQRSKRCHEEIISNGNSGEFRAVEKLRHDVNSVVVEQVQSLLDL